MRPLRGSLSTIFAVLVLPWLVMNNSCNGEDKPQAAKAEEKAQTIKVLVKFDANLPKAGRADVTVRLEDVTQEGGVQKPDLPQVSRKDVSIADAKEGTVLVLRGVTIDPDAVYNLRVILDATDKGKAGKEKYVTSQRFSFDGSSIPKNKKGENEVEVKLTPDTLRKQ